MAIVLAKVDDIPLNSNKSVHIDGKDYLLCHFKGGFRLTNLDCPHQKQSLEGGKVKAHFLFCPVHGVRFNLETGEPFGSLTKNCLQFYGIDVVDGDVVLTGSL